MKRARTEEKVLALYPTTRGIGFVVATAPLSPIDWGTKDAEGDNKNAQCLEKAAALIEAHQPDVLLLEDPTAPGSLRRPRILRLSKALAALANTQALDVYPFTYAAVRECFGEFGVRSRYDIAMAIAKSVPAFEEFLPPPRRAWETEHARMSVFNAAALVMTFFATRSQ
jgi:hypothetical protein